MFVSPASTYSCSTSVAGDDRSSISSSSSSQSDASYGSRLPFWAEPLAKLHLSTETASSSSTLKALTRSDDGLYAAVMGGPGASSASARAPRSLHDSGRQSSLDSGIGTAAGSQSSYSGSVSSCTGSLDTASQGAGGEFGSVASLPPLSSPPSAPPPTPPPPPQSILITPNGSATSSRPGASRCSSQASQRHSDEPQNPLLLSARYDTPRSLIHTLCRRDLSANGGAAQLGDGVGGQSGRQALMRRSLSWGSEVAPDPRPRSTPPAGGTPPGGLMDGGTQVWRNYVRWQWYVIPRPNRHNCSQ